MRRSRDKLPGHALSLSLKNIWEVIKDQRDLNLPAHKVSLGFNWKSACMNAASPS